MGENIIELRFNYTRESFVLARKDYLRVFPEPSAYKVISWTLRAGFIVFSLMPIGMIWYWQLRGVPVSFLNPLTISMYAIIIGIVAWELVNWIRKRLRPASNNFDQDNRWQGERQWVIKDTELLFISPIRESIYKWVDFHQVIEGSSCFLFVDNAKKDRNWFYLPKYAFTTEIQKEQFKEIVKQTIDFKEIK